MALVMIARDEARCIARSLASVRPWVDEMIVLDTGSRDATPAIAQRFGARVERFAWVDHFAAARNAALACTQADWRIVLDADEWLASGAEVLASLRALEPSFVGVVRVASVLEHGATNAASWLPRVLPSGVGYCGRIHEQPDTELPRRRLALTIGHDGYLGAPMAAKAGRNRRLLELALVEHPGDAYLHYQLGKDFEVRADYAAAAPCYRRAHELAPPAAAWRHDLVLRALFTLKKIGRVDEAFALAGSEQPHWAESPDFHFALGDLWLERALAQPAFASQWLPRIEASWLRALEIGERPDLPDTVCGRGSFLAAHNLAAFHRSLGRIDAACEWDERALRLRAAVLQGADASDAQIACQAFRSADVAADAPEKAGHAGLVQAIDELPLA